jgi:hypothetical protein
MARRLIRWREIASRCRDLMMLLGMVLCCSAKKLTVHHNFDSCQPRQQNENVVITVIAQHDVAYLFSDAAEATKIPVRGFSMISNSN